MYPLQSKTKTLENSLLSRQFHEKILPTLTPQQIQTIQNPKPKKWIFSSSQCLKFFPHIISTQCQKISIQNYISHNKDEQKQITLSNLDPSIILTTLNYPLFISLKELNISSNKILSIENVPFIKMDSLKCLDISLNLITCFKAIQKTKWTNLQEIYFFTNMILQLELYRVKMNPKFKVFNSDFNKNIQMQDASALMKIQPLQVQSVDLSRNSKIIYTKLINIIPKKWNNKYIQIMWGMLYYGNDDD